EVKIQSYCDASVRVQKLRVFRQIKDLRTEFDALTLAYGCDFMQREVPVADPWPTTNSSWRIAKGTQRNSIVGEQRGIEPITAILTRILRFEGSGLVRRSEERRVGKEGRYGGAREG